jgi:hypothetical protein
MIVAIDNAGRLGTTRFPSGRGDVVLSHLMIERKAAQKTSRKWREGPRNPLKRLDSRKERAWIFLP